MNNPHPSKYAAFNFPLFLLLAVFWSGSFINIKITVDALPPVFSALIRVFISLLTLSLLFFILRKKVLFPIKKCWKIWVAGLFTQAMPFALLFYGEKYIAPALASIINSTVSLWALLLGSLLFRDMSQWTPVKISGLLLGFFGILVIFLPYINSHANSLLGITAIVGMAICYAMGGLLNQHVIFKQVKVSFEANLFQQHVSSILFLLIISLSLETWPSVADLINMKLIGAFLYLGVVATAIAWLIYFYLLREWGAVLASSVMYIVPVLALCWDSLFLHIRPVNNEIIGMIIILFALILLQRFGNRKQNKEIIIGD